MKFENEGPCVDTSMQNVAMAGNALPIWEKTKANLGDRTLYMVYSKNGCAKEMYAVELFTGTELGYELSIVLKEKIEECVYPNIGKKILITDVINEKQIPEDAKQYQDEKFIVGIRETSEDIVQMFIYKK